ncbi:rhamnogalacturonan acetylesterase [Metabacillus halosaccharovorans]|uniref:rhamnogalacturonan acetylesterase n=1 Tax=Metabacillus halosaccharovorans TaxID=930124 RepID=UPI001C1FAB53|nr:rhamnogalacturonan acetylesterase [Metabacillus halosaccharovorans]MBU7591553.1 rhamnogalacturonan acetylesterase [Metabacillus halosaccharovorans]
MEKSYTIYLAGDSTVANCPNHEAPMAGWGQTFHEFFQKNILIINKAMGGRSSNSFIEEGRLEAIMNEIQPDDFLFIQFGHNDQKSYGTEPYTTFQSNLTEYITGARTKGAYPILITPVHRRKFNEDGILENTLGEYPEAMMDLAEKLDVPLIDLWSKTRKLYEELGVEGSKKLFTIFAPNEQPNYPDGIIDNTHFSEHGAKEVARLVIEGIRDLRLPIEKYICEKNFLRS